MRPLLVLLLLAACSPSAKEARPGSKVRLHYELQGYSSTRPGAPVEAVLGDGLLPPGLEAGLWGLKAGERKRIIVMPEAAYGPWRSELVKKAPQAAFAGLGPLKPGQQVKGVLEGKAAEARLVALGGGEVTLDFNHPLAGKTLVFEVELLSVD
jgi:FKBP-type peptidyl-prolyl cis-trans isomerase 2